MPLWLSVNWILKVVTIMFFLSFRFGGVLPKNPGCSMNTVMFWPIKKYSWFHCPTSLLNKFYTLSNSAFITVLGQKCCEKLASDNTLAWTMLSNVYWFKGVLIEKPMYWIYERTTFAEWISNNVYGVNKASAFIVISGKTSLVRNIVPTHHFN